MAWTPPRTWTTSQLVTAADLNTDLRDNLNYLDDRANTDTAAVTGLISTNSTSYTQTGSISVTLTTIGKPVLLVADFHGLRLGDMIYRGYLRWYNATLAADVGDEHQTNNDQRIPTAIIGLETPTPGTYTWYMRWRVNNSSVSIYTEGLRLWAIELM